MYINNMRFGKEKPNAIETATINDIKWLKNMYLEDRIQFIQPTRSSYHIYVIIVDEIFYYYYFIEILFDFFKEILLKFTNKIKFTNLANNLAKYSYFRNFESLFILETSEKYIITIMNGRLKIVEVESKWYGRFLELHNIDLLERCTE